MKVTAEDIPFRFTGFRISAFDMDLAYEVLAPVEITRPEEYDELKQLNPDKLYHQDVSKAQREVIQGLWTDNGGYVDLSQRGGVSSMVTTPDGTVEGNAGVSYPHPIDPAAVTAVKLGGIRVELRELERLDE